MPPHLPDPSGLSIPDYRPLPVDLPFVAFNRQGRWMQISGQIPDIPGLEPIRGRLGEDVSIELGREAAHRAALNVLSVLRHAAGGLERVSRITKLTGFVSSGPGFTDQPSVVNAASEVFVSVWGAERGRHARSAIGVAGLPFGVPVEIELIAEVGDEDQRLETPA